MNIRIGGRNFDCKWDTEELGYTAQEDICGTILEERQAIAICGRIHPEKQRQTLLHELIHAVDNNVKMGLTEAQTHQMASGLYAILTDNPDMAKWITTGKRPKNG
jgi:hypothetical protein